MTDNFEHILLKKLTHNGEYFGKALPILKSKYFKDIGNQELFKLIKEHYNTYRNIPTLVELVATVKNVSNAEIRQQIVNSLQTISKTDEVANMDFMIDETVAWVKDSIHMEALRIGAEGQMKKDDKLILKSRQLMEEYNKVSIDTDLGLDFDDIDEMIAYYSERHIGVLTQHKELNKRLGAGFLPGTLSVILAASGVGKSLLMTDLVSGMIKNGKNVLLISLEMSDKEIMKRVHANAMELPINSLIDLAKTDGEKEKIKAENPTREFISKDDIVSAYNKLKTSGSCGKFFVKDYPTGSFSPLMLEQLVESYKIEKGITFDAIFVDYVGIMKSDLLSPSAGLYSYIKSIAEEIRASAKKMGVAVISASQLNRGATNNVEDTDNSNVSDSMGTVMTADFMLFLLQNEEMKEKKEIVLKCTKNRFAGRTDTWMMNIDYVHMKFHDMVTQSEVDVMTALGNTNDELNRIKNQNSVDSDFGIITVGKQEKAEEYANSEIKNIINNDIQLVKEIDKKDPFTDTDALYKELGIDL